MGTTYNLYRGGSGPAERREEPRPSPQQERRSPLPPQGQRPSGGEPRSGKNQPARQTPEGNRQNAGQGTGQNAGHGAGQNPRRPPGPGHASQNQPRQNRGAPPDPPRPEPEKKPEHKGRSADTLRDIRSGLDGILSRLDPGKLETEDLLVLAILWLLYRDSGDKELLIALAAYLFV